MQILKKKSVGGHPWLKRHFPKGRPKFGDQNSFTDFLIHYNKLKHKNQCINDITHLAVCNF